MITIDLYAPFQGKFLTVIVNDNLYSVIQIKKPKTIMVVFLESLK